MHSLLLAVSSFAWRDRGNLKEIPVKVHGVSYRIGTRCLRHASQHMYCLSELHGTEPLQFVMKFAEFYET
jgi:hypothetical protein